MAIGAGQVSGHPRGGTRMIGPAAAPIRVLVVDSNPRDVLLLRELLADTAPARFEIQHVDRASAALGHPDLDRFDVALLDLHLPDAHGFEALAGIAQRAPSLPVLISSGASDEATAVEALRRGAQDYLVKGQGDGLLVARAIRYAIERKKIEDRLAWMALHDPLTGLLNRNAFRSQLDHTLARAERNGEAVAVFFLDLDDFKKINDTLGHNAGDLVLQSVAERLRGAVREMDVVARMGGDEFTVLVESVPSREGAETVARKILGAVEHPIRLAGRSVRVTASVGLAYCDRARTCAADLLVRGADEAMYRAKALGGGSLQVVAESASGEGAVAVCKGFPACQQGEAACVCALALAPVGLRPDRDGAAVTPVLGGPEPA